MPGDGITHRKKTAQISRAVLSGGCPYGNEQHVGMLYRQLLVGGEEQALVIKVFTHQIGQPRFVNMHLAQAQLVDLGLINVHADNVVTDFGKHGCLYQAYVSATENADFHGKNPEVVGCGCVAG